MLSFLKKIFGAKPVDTSNPAPYKFEVVPVSAADLPVVLAVKAEKPTAKKAVTAKPKTPRKPRAPKA